MQLEPKHTQGPLAEKLTMPQAWSNKRERQYQHIKEQTGQRGTSPGRARSPLARETRTAPRLANQTG